MDHPHTTETQVVGELDRRLAEEAEAAAETAPDSPVPAAQEPQEAVPAEAEAAAATRRARSRKDPGDETPEPEEGTP